MSYNFGFALSYLITPLVIKGVDMPKLNLNSSFAIIDPIRTQREILKLNIPVAAITILVRRLKNRIRYIFDIYQTYLIFIDLKSFSWNIDNSTRYTSNISKFGNEKEIACSLPRTLKSHFLYIMYKCIIKSIFFLQIAESSIKYEAARIPRRKLFQWSDAFHKRLNRNFTG